MLARFRTPFHNTHNVGEGSLKSGELTSEETDLYIAILIMSRLLESRRERRIRDIGVQEMQQTREMHLQDETRIV